LTYRKKLIEVALPLEAINICCKADKDRKTGTIRNLHKWFAPMPSPAWRAALTAAIIDDPGDNSSRTDLLQLIENLCPADGTMPPDQVLRRAQLLIQEAGRGQALSVFDPFCGGGSTVMEAQRLGCRALGADLNPVPVLITKFLTDVLPHVSRRTTPLKGQVLSLGNEVGPSIGAFASDVRHYALRIRENAWAKIGRHYPPAPNGDAVIAWRWARTAPSPDPRFQGAQTPLVGDWWLSKKPGLRAFVHPVVDRQHLKVAFEIRAGGEPESPSKGRCLFSNAPLTFEYIRRSGRDGLLGVVLLATIAHGPHGRQHFPPSDEQLMAAVSARPEDVPEVELPKGGLGFRVQEYGLTRWSQIFTDRQLAALSTFADLAAQVTDWAIEDGADADYAAALTIAIGICVGKLASFASTQSLWRLDSRNGSGKAEAAFGRAALPMTFDFVETNPFGGSVGDWLQVVDTTIRAYDSAVLGAEPALVSQADARSSGALAADALVAMDPPYYSQIGYADLSDFFYVWLRQALKTVEPDLFSTLLTPKKGELIADPARHGGSAEAARDYFVAGFIDTLRELAASANPEYPLLVVYAYRQQESALDGYASTGWEAMLEAMIGAGLAVVGTWPIHGTGTTRQRAQKSNALASYILVVCRPRAVSAASGKRTDLLRALRLGMPKAVADLQASAIAPVDLAQASIGPGMAVFSSYAKVIEADGSAMSVRTALSIINQVLDETLAQQEEDFDSSTRWAVAWFEQFDMKPGDYGVAETLSKAKNSAVNALVEAGIVAARAGKVRLLDRGELLKDWDPQTDRRITVWEATQHLIRALETGGENAAADLVGRLGGLAEKARELSYRLYSISERKRLAKEALSYNGLVAAWPAILRVAAEQSGQAVQMSLGG